MTLQSTPFAPSSNPIEPLEHSKFADHTTPLIKNCWYVAALSQDITREIMAKQLLGVHVALYRTLAGQVVAVRNRCPHRSFPLSKGKLEGDILICGYHGMQFNPSGHCVKMPALPIVPTHADVQGFPVKEKGPLVWIWMGNPDRADESLIPNTDWLHDENWKTVSGFFPIKADYVSMHENLLDQTHFPFLHPGAIGTPEYARSKLEVRFEDKEIIIDRALLNSPPPGVYAMPTGLAGKPVNRFSEAKFVSPALHRAFAKIVDPRDEGLGPRTYRFNITHIFTPQTQHSIHYWWFCSRDFKHDEPAIDEHLLSASQQAYKEDVDALEWIMENILSDAEPQFDLHFAPDKPGLMMRQYLHQLSTLEGN